ncbi:Chromatin assembly factor 1 subunit A [Penicillium malachiteum]|uniref:Chromatin assembly factor 1 subunit A n=1 Tax=Penicillium malachiteum TaxID=1324776 RepID=A0AAD6HCK8_9EURO|nr:Chromatin assembly factor 1 subunit A [Penicillium malachiteum]
MRFPLLQVQTDPSPCADPVSVPLPPSPVAFPVGSVDATISPTSLSSGCETSPQVVSAPIPAPTLAVAPASTMPVISKDDGPQVSFEEFATKYRQSQRKQVQRKRLEQRLRATKVSIGVSARMIRIGNTMQRGLVEALKHDDKANFIALYHMLYDLQESCVCVSNDQYGAHYDSPDGQDSIPDADLDHSSDFFHQLSPQSQGDLLEILQLVRSNPQFLVDRLRSFTSAQLAVLTTPAAILDTNDPAFASSPSSPSRYQSQYSFNRTMAQAAPFKDHIYAFERTNPLSILLFNVFAAPMEPETPEAQLRVDVWSSVCAQLIAHGSNRFYPLISQILSSWATGSNWKARPKFELYLMDILQTGAFLLEHVEPAVGLDFATETLDPLRTEVAEEFFASAVDDLFRVLDDPDSGFPYAVLQFARAVLRKIDNPDIRSRFLEFLFLQWFFPKFLYGALTYPETHGLLLDFHIRKDARDRLLNQVGLRAYSQVFASLRSMHHYSILRPAIKERVNSMLGRFSSTPVSKSPGFVRPSLSRRSPSTFLLLSATDVNTLLDALFPQTLSSFQSTPASSIFSMDSSSISTPETDLAQNAARIRFELTDLDEPSERSKLEYPSDEYWTIFSVSKDGHSLAWSLLPIPDAGLSKISVIESDDDTQNLGLEENYEALQTAIVRLVKENHVYDSDDEDYHTTRSANSAPKSLKQRFNQAMAAATNDSDFVGAHYWWNVSRQLKQGQGRLSSSPDAADDSWILGPMHNLCIRSLNKSRVVVERCETDFVSLDHSLRRLQTRVNDLMATLSKVRNKIWYMTDVKNSMRYEDAKHVAMALKNMNNPARLLTNMSEDSRSRSTARSLGGSLFQKPEQQVINIMKAPNSQGGPKKLSDEQVELTRKWLSHNGIENFCKGEERIHRFCYEVQTSINQLVGETMTETPVLWASELFQRERARYESYGARAFPSLSIPTTPRPSTTASEDPMHISQSRLSQDMPSLSRKSSIQSLLSDKWRPNRDLPSIDMSSLGGSPGRAASVSTTTTDTLSTFWSRPQRQPVYAASVSSAYSRPPSTFSKTINRQPRRNERKDQGRAAQDKTVFMDNLRQTLTSLLLSDLGSPVWSCGSETDAWFTGTLDQARVRLQMKKRAAVHKFYVDYDERSNSLSERRQSGSRRSRSLDAPHVRASMHSQSSSESPDEQRESSDVYSGSSQDDDQSIFSYKAVFHRLIEVFSRHGNPFVKLNALRDLRSLVIASLVPSQETNPADIRPVSPENNRARNSNNRNAQRAARSSFSETQLPKGNQLDAGPSISPPKSVTCGSRPSDHPTPSEDKIVATLRDLLLEVKPKTLFRDLQFISAFIPPDQLSKGDQGTAFLQFGLAALSLKDEVCHSMVEIADRIVSQELLRRHPFGSDFYPRSTYDRTLEDAAGMWIITAKEGNPVAQRELAILYLTHPELIPRVTLPLTRPRDTFKAEMMYMRGKDSKSDPQSMCLALHWMQLSASGGDLLARNRLREREEFDSIA